MALDLYVFTSASQKNIEIGVEHGMWAIPKPKTLRMHRQFTTKALKMPVGAHGVFYLSGLQLFTTPFIVASQPDPDVTEREVWDGEFFLPFHIHALSDAWPWIEKREIKRMLPTLCLSEKGWDQQILIKPIEAFLPSKLTNRDWEALVGSLAPVQERQMA
jgi:hypothetical protein